jgi:hypothetical protein
MKMRKGSSNIENILNRRNLIPKTSTMRNQARPSFLATTKVNESLIHKSTEKTSMIPGTPLSCSGMSNASFL